ncbi:hypothetical protein PTT_09490 [Pyrenophora teres f. teres 0-1]|uniref:Uncharacterized protein n=1 Tax=Pyrenophora teres f. teres (strain 0-1) TaxID=861557 RepID=E3RM51_PYRTT|nr:hypothetical protein PTT_09490 [Pyrenophora teres f. teres 0-1]
MTPAAARERMDIIYWNLDPPLFISLENGEVDAWTTNLPQGVLKRMLKEDGQLDYDLARGRLHRLFVGEFVELIRPEEQHAEKNRRLLADWRKAYEEKYGKKFKDDMEAVNAFIERYGEDTAVLREPFLAASPLHWPSMDYLLALKYSDKRKATSDPESPPKNKKPKK